MLSCAIGGGDIIASVEKRLLCLLRGSLLSANVPADVSSIAGLLDNALEGSPTLLGSGRSALVGKLSVNAGSELVDSLLDKAALRNAGTEEDGVDNEQDPRAPLEEDAEPEEDLK